MADVVENKISIMQPYFFPYVGYFQLISNVDKFIVYDEIQFSKQSWITRNYVLDQNGARRRVGLALKKDSDYLNINERYVSDSFDYSKILTSIKASYSRSKYLGETLDLLDEILSFPDKNLFNYLFNSIKQVTNYIGINTVIQKSSEVEKNFGLKSQQRVISICQDLEANIYINPIGGIQLYSREVFSSCGIDLRFLEAKQTPYKQFTHGFERNLSIIDLLMNLSKHDIADILNEDFQIK
jgi:hypothetical protein